MMRRQWAHGVVCDWRKHGLLQTEDVPGDGLCFYHAVSRIIDTMPIKERVRLNQKVFIEMQKIDDPQICKITEFFGRATAFSPESLRVAVNLSMIVPDPSRDEMIRAREEVVKAILLPEERGVKTTTPQKLTSGGGSGEVDPGDRDFMLTVQFAQYRKVPPLPGTKLTNKYRYDVAYSYNASKRVWADDFTIALTEKLLGVRVVILESQPRSDELIPSCGFDHGAEWEPSAMLFVHKTSGVGRHDAAAHYQILKLRDRSFALREEPLPPLLPMLGDVHCSKMENAYQKLAWDEMSADALARADKEAAGVTST